MKKRTLFFLYALACLIGIFTGMRSEAFMPANSGWWYQQQYCPTCYRNQMMMTGTTPWGYPNPWWWNTGPMMYSNFYSPSPWSYGPMPGVMPNYYPGGGQYFAAKPNLYIEGPAGTEVQVKIRFSEEGANWLAAVPVHGSTGWRGKLNDRSRIETDSGTYSFLYSDWRAYGKTFQDQEGFCADKKEVITQMARRLSLASFTPREIADFADYWSVKLPPTDRYCVYPQDERQLNAIAPIEASPSPISVRRVLFMVQVEEGLKKNGKLFSAEPVREWKPGTIRIPAAESRGIKIREWGVGFIGTR